MTPEMSSGRPNISDYMPLVTGEARRLASDSFVVEDLVQEGLMAAMKALGSYDSARGSREAYVRICARNGMISYLRKNGKKRGEFSADAEDLERLAEFSSAPDGSFDPLWPGSSTGSPNPASLANIVEARDALAGLIDRLSSFEQAVLAAYLSEGSVTRAARRLGCSRKRLDNAMQRVRNKARAMPR